jgi:hypothetical protein
MERDALFTEPSFTVFHSHWQTTPSPLPVPQLGPYGERCQFPQPSFIYPSEFLVMEPSLQVPLAELP